MKISLASRPLGALRSSEFDQAVLVTALAVVRLLLIAHFGVAAYPHFHGQQMQKAADAGSMAGSIRLEQQRLSSERKRCIR